MTNARAGITIAPRNHSNVTATQRARSTSSRAGRTASSTRARPTSTCARSATFSAARRSARRARRAARSAPRSSGASSSPPRPHPSGRSAAVTVLKCNPQNERNRPIRSDATRVRSTGKTSRQRLSLRSCAASTTTAPARSNATARPACPKARSRSGRRSCRRRVARSFLLQMKGRARPFFFYE